MTPPTPPRPGWFSWLRRLWPRPKPKKPTPRRPPPGRLGVRGLEDRSVP